MTRRLLIVVLVIGPLLGWAAPPLPPRMASDVEFDSLSLRLNVSAEQAPVFVLSYVGKRVEFVGLLCYWFAGYNETCMDPKLDWLTPATEIALYAPGGVPAELLSSYVMLVRFPSMSEATFRYEVRP